MDVKPLSNKMKLFLSFVVAISSSLAQSVIESASFGYGSSISPNKHAIPGWHISGEGHTPNLLSDRVIMTPPYPGRMKGALWTDSRISKAEWVANVDFRATGPEYGGGNLQIWYTKEGREKIGTSTVYTVGKFEGLVVIIDMHGGKGGSVRAFLNDGNVDYQNHHHIESLAFGHCDYSYRNLGRPSQIQMKQDKTGFEVSVDKRLCFRSDKVLLPSDNYFGITAASSETPDTFDVFKFVLTTPPSAPGEAHDRSSKPPVTANQGNTKPLIQHQQSPPTVPAVDNSQLKDVTTQLQQMSRSIDGLLRDVSTESTTAQKRQDAILQALRNNEQVNTLVHKIQSIEDAIHELKREVQSRDYNGRFDSIEQTLQSTHDTLLGHMPERLAHLVTSRAPRVGFFVVLLVVFQLLLVAAYVAYKRRRANMPKKYL